MNGPLLLPPARFPLAGLVVEDVAFEGTGAEAAAIAADAGPTATFSNANAGVIGRFRVADNRLKLVLSDLEKTASQQLARTM